MNKILLGDSLIRLREMPDESVHSCVTSPPYWGLRDYGVAGQMGLEKTPEEFTSKMVELFREVKRVLRSDGTLWLNIGDSYAGSGRGGDKPGHEGKQSTNRGTKSMADYAERAAFGKKWVKPPKGLKQKDLVGIPWMLAFALRADGWYLRSDIIWAKPNPMPESVTDRPTKAHEYIFLLSKKSKYYYDAASIRTEGKNPIDDIRRLAAQKSFNKSAATAKVGGLRARMPAPVGGWHQQSPKTPQGIVDKQRGHVRRHTGFNDRWDDMPKEEQQMRANKRTVWSVATMPFKEAHFATFPEKLIEPMILASTPPKGIVLDPFMGAGTTGLVAKKLGRQYLGIELNPAYITIAEKRISAVPAPMF